MLAKVDKFTTSDDVPIAELNVGELYVFGDYREFPNVYMIAGTPGYKSIVCVSGEETGLIHWDAKRFRNLSVKPLKVRVLAALQEK